jgi:hypothetical protein
MDRRTVPVLLDPGEPSSVCRSPDFLLKLVGRLVSHVNDPEIFPYLAISIFFFFFFWYSLFPNPCKKRSQQVLLSAFVPLAGQKGLHPELSLEDETRRVKNFTARLFQSFI